MDLLQFALVHSHPSHATVECSASPVFDPIETAWYSFSTLDSPMTSTRVSRGGFPGSATCPTVDLLVFKAADHGFHTHCPSRHKGVSNHCTTRSFPLKYRPSLLNRCISTSLGRCIRLARFSARFPSSSLSIANQTTTVRQAVGFLHTIPFLHDSPACPLSWYSHTAVQTRSR